MKSTVDYYMINASAVRSTMNAAKFEVYGGENSPYLWIRVPDSYLTRGDKEGGSASSPSWVVFQELLEHANVVITPGLGFGSEGNNFFRISCFAHKENVDEAVGRIAKHFSSQSQTLLSEM
eukprot:GHVT01032431.1.p1 GENE.GHVT01032431.1~~GHVT01032431.1.p1  ORF type:complete len:121 (+),score=17.80 GHVT01032431.1:197-559(+)